MRLEAVSRPSRAECRRGRTRGGLLAELVLRDSATVHDQVQVLLGDRGRLEDVGLDGVSTRGGEVLWGRRRRSDARVDETVRKRHAPEFGALAERERRGACHLAELVGVLPHVDVLDAGRDVLEVGLVAVLTAERRIPVALRGQSARDAERRAVVLGQDRVDLVAISDRLVDTLPCSTGPSRSSRRRYTSRRPSAIRSHPCSGP